VSWEDTAEFPNLPAREEFVGKEGKEKGHGIMKSKKSNNYNGFIRYISSLFSFSVDNSDKERQYLQ
jgi:hypothetical protein